MGWGLGLVSHLRRSEFRLLVTQPLRAGLTCAAPTGLVWSGAADRVGASRWITLVARAAWEKRIEMGWRLGLVSHLRRSEFRLLVTQPLRAGLTYAAPTGLVWSGVAVRVGASRWIKLWCGSLGKAVANAPHLTRAGRWAAPFRFIWLGSAIGTTNAREWGWLL
jgi:hypothetical protein